MTSAAPVSRVHPPTQIYACDSPAPPLTLGAAVEKGIHEQVIFAEAQRSLHRTCVNDTFGLDAAALYAIGTLCNRNALSSLSDAEPEISESLPGLLWWCQG